MIREEDKKENKAIGRKEIVFVVTHEGKPQPSRAELEKLLPSKIKEKYFVIKKIESRFGKAESRVVVHAYKDEKTMKHYEPAHLFKRGKPKKEETKEEKING